MTPHKLDMLLRLHTSPAPFYDMPAAQIFAPSMRDAFDYFSQHGLLAEGVTHASVDCLPMPAEGATVFPLLSAKGQRLVAFICSIEPGDIS